MADIQSVTTYRTEPGYTYPREEVVVTAHEQQRLHAHCAIAGSVFGDYADPTFIGRRPILLNTDTVHACHPECAPVHTVQRVEQRRPVRLGETLEMAGRVEALTGHPRGWVLETRWDYCDANGETVFVVRPDVLMVDPARTPPPRRSDTSASSEDADFERLTRKECTPESTLGYCDGSVNKIHLDPDYARQFGFRAPIIAGIQSMNFLIEPIIAAKAPEQLSVSVRFLRPVFWDDTVTVEGRRNDEGALSYLRAVNGAGKTVADCTIESCR